MSFADTHAAADCEYATVNTAVSAATYGDTVTVPAGTCTWGSTLTMTKGIILTAAGIGSTIITHNGSGDYVMSYSPDATSRAADQRFEVSGFTFLGTGRGILLEESNSETVPSKNIVIHHNQFSHTGLYPIGIDGNFWGVIYSNTFDGNLAFSVGGNQRYSWDTFVYGTYGTADNMYYEDNTFSGSSAFYINSGHGGRWSWRYNTSTATYMENPLLDQHGNQAGDIYALMLCEVYGNIFTGFTTGINKWDYQRGGKLLMFNNTMTGTGGTPNITVNDDVDDAVSPVNDSGLSIQHPNNDYFFNNTFNGTRIDGTEGVDCCGSIAENSEFFNYNAACTTSSCAAGIGAGTTAPTGTCTTGTAYWVTSFIPASTPPTTLADMKTYTQAGTLYKCTATNTWTLFYTPYTYPHPLREEADVTPPVMSNPSPSGVLNCVTDPGNKTISLNTSEASKCQYDTSDTTFDLMANAMDNTYVTNHSATLSLACGAAYTYYARCVDAADNKNTSSLTISFTIGTLAASSKQIISTGGSQKITVRPVGIPSIGAYQYMP